MIYSFFKSLRGHKVPQAFRGGIMLSVNGPNYCTLHLTAAWECDSVACSTCLLSAAAWGCCFAAAWVTNSAGAFYFDDDFYLQGFASEARPGELWFSLAGLMS